MENIGIILVGTLMSAFLFASFWFGYFFCKKRDKDEEGLTVTDANKEFVEEMQKWRNYGGR